MQPQLQPGPAPLPEPAVDSSRLQDDLCFLGWALELEMASAEETLRWAFERWPEGPRVVTSFQAEGMVVLDLCHRLGLEPRIATLDTGRLPEETYTQIERVRQRYGFDVDILLPDASDVEQMIRQAGPNLFLESVAQRERCCQVRKVRPMKLALAGEPAWIAGVRRDQTTNRGGLRKIERDRVLDPRGELLKVSPLLDWSEDQVWEYIRENSVPYHPLYDQGYRTIGCAPCTRPSRPGEGARGGRWFWENSQAKECGLHIVQGGA